MDLSGKFLKWGCFALAAVLLALVPFVEIVLETEIPEWLRIVLTAITVAAPLMAISAILFQIDELKSAVKGERESLSAIREQVSQAVKNNTKQLHGGQVFYLDLQQEILKPSVTLARLTAIRARAMHDKDYSGQYYEKVLKRCKDDRKTFRVRRFIGVPNDTMLDFARKNLTDAGSSEYRPALDVRVTPWCNPVSGFNMAIPHEGDHLSVLYIVMTMDDDIVAMKFLEPGERAAPFVQLFDKLWEDAKPYTMMPDNTQRTVEDALDLVNRKLTGFREA